jgi:AAA domain-containing protein/bifunctional DNA primase/polymerase-like protein
MIDLRAMHASVEEYLERGWPIVPIPPIGGRPAKGPTEKGWPDHLLEAGCASSILREGWNIGLVLRELSDVDLDVAAARAAAPIFLPSTGLIYGRASSPASHRLYKTTTPLPYKKFALPEDHERGDLLELRAMQPANGNMPKAFQSVLPPSAHPSGEQYEWSHYGEAAIVDSKVLWRAVHLTAITTALAKLHPALDDAHKSARDGYRLALSGVLARRLPESDALNVFTTALRISGDHKDRQSIFQTTLNKLHRDRDAKVAGVPALRELVGDAATVIVNWIDCIAERSEPKAAKPTEREPGDESEKEVHGPAHTAAVEEEILVDSFANVTAKPIDWLWRDRIPKNKLTIFSGNPDVGKSTVIIDVIARYTTGRDYPDGAKNTEPPREVLMLIAEDDVADTAKPRMLAADGDIDKVHFVKCVEIRRGAKKAERMLALDTDLNLLERKLLEYPNIGLVVFDPITNYLGKAELNREQELRRVLGPIRDWAEYRAITIVGLGHFNKRSDVTALHRVGGAVAMSGVPRAVWLFVKDPDETDLYKMLLGKGNLTKKRTGLKYRFVEKVLETGGVPIIGWGGETTDDAEDAVMVGHDPEARKNAKAKHFLAEHFKAHPGLQPSAPIIEEAEKHGIAETTLFYARKSLGIKASRPSGVWCWEPKE